MRDTQDPRGAEVLRFWFGEGAAYGQPRKLWFEKNREFDEELRRRFGTLHDEAARGGLRTWLGHPGDCLALIVVLDQFSRNLYRSGSAQAARAYASDGIALDAARHAIAAGYDRATLAVERMFVYLPYEHSEALEDQLRSCELMQALAGFPETADLHRYAVRHLEIVQRFGRFPHRNAALGRASTREEIEFLAQPGSGF